MSPQREIALYIGTYTRPLPHVDGHGEGIYRCRLDLATGALACDGVVAPLDNPTFLALDPAGRRLYAVSEADETTGAAGGAVHAFAIHDDALLPLNWQLTRGAAPCHLAVDPAGRSVLTANYNGGSVTVLPIGKDGRVEPPTQLIRHTGAGPHPIRQTAAHPHGVTFDTTGRYVFVPDLGADKVFIYRLAAGQTALMPHEPPWALIHPGAGPRHLALHPNGRWVYCINELDVTVSALAFDPDTGRLVERGWFPLLPNQPELPISPQPGEPDENMTKDRNRGFSRFDPLNNRPPDPERGLRTGSIPVMTTHSEQNHPNALNSGAEIALDPAGRFLYASLRGHDSIAICAITPEGNGLTLLGHEPTQGRAPRHFALTPDGRLLVAANQDSDSVVTFRVDPATGGLTPTGFAAQIPSPVCVLVQPAKNDEG